MQQLLTILFITLTIPSFSQIDVSFIKYHNQQLVKYLNDIYEFDYKVAKVGKNKRGFGFDHKKIYYTEWSKLKSKPKSQFKEIMAGYDIKEIEDFYHKIHTFNQIHAGYHSYHSKFPMKVIIKMNKNAQTYESEQLCSDVLVAYWKSVSEYADTYNYIKRVVMDVVGKNEALQSREDFMKPNKNKNAYWPYFFHYLHASFEREHEISLESVKSKIVENKRFF